MLNKKTAIATAKLFINDLKALGYNPAQAWLFGSTVSGRVNKNSDIDIAVWDEKFSGVMFLDIEKIKYLLVKYRQIELHSYPIDSTENDDPFISEIKKHGEQLI